jgi:hypothetical protein
VDELIDYKRLMSNGMPHMELFLGKKASALIPIVMSLIALVLVVVQVSIHGMSPERDEGAVAHLYQLLVIGQMPVITFFGARWLPRAPAQGLRVVAVQAFALAAALVPVYVMGW